MEYTKVTSRENFVSWCFLPKSMISGLSNECIAMIKKWNGFNGLRVLASFLSYIEKMPRTIVVLKERSNKKGFMCQDIHGELIEVEIGTDELKSSTVTLRTADIARTFQCVDCPGYSSVLVSLTSYSYTEGSTIISRFLDSSFCITFFDRAEKDEHLTVFIDNSSNTNNLLKFSSNNEEIISKPVKHFVLHDEESVFRNISDLETLYDIPRVCAALYHNTGQQMLGNIIELSNYDEEDEYSCKEGFVAKIKDGVLISYKMKKCFQNGSIVIITATLVDGEYKIDYETYWLTEEGKIAVQEEVGSFMDEHKLQTSELNKKLQKVLE